MRHLASDVQEPAAELADAEAEPLATDDSEAAIVAEVLAGDAAAFAKIVERHQARLHRILYRFVGHREDAGELTQQAFLSAYAALARYNPLYPFAPWLVRIGVNLAKDHLKSAQRREMVEAPEDLAQRARESSDDPEAALAQAQRRALLSRALAKLSVSDREIIVLKDIEELSFDEIQTIVRRPITALKIRAFRARRRLRDAIEAMGTKEDPS